MPFSYYPPGHKISNNYFGKKPIGDTYTFKLLLFFLGNGCSPHLTSQHWTTLRKATNRANQIDFIYSNLNSKATIWFYYDIHHATWLSFNGEFRNINSLYVFNLTDSIFSRTEKVIYIYISLFFSQKIS